jgi:hypothetical protein
MLLLRGALHEPSREGSGSGPAVGRETRRLPGVRDRRPPRGGPRDAWATGLFAGGPLARVKRSSRHFPATCHPFKKTIMGSRLAP